MTDRLFQVEVLLSLQERIYRSLSLSCPIVIEMGDVPALQSPAGQFVFDEAVHKFDLWDTPTSGITRPDMNADQAVTAVVAAQVKRRNAHGEDV